MGRGRPKAALVLPEPEREQLATLTRSRSLPKGLVDRVQIVLLSAAGETNKAIAARLGLSQPTVGKWRKRYLEHGLQGLHDELRPGRPRSIEDERIATLITTTLRTKPEARVGVKWRMRRASSTGLPRMRSMVGLTLVAEMSANLCRARNCIACSSTATLPRDSGKPASRQPAAALRWRA